MPIFSVNLFNRLKAKDLQADVAGPIALPDWFDKPLGKVDGAADQAMVAKELLKLKQ